MNSIKISWFSLILFFVSSLAFAEKTYNCTAVVDGKTKNSSTQIIVIQITVMNSQNYFDAETKAINILNKKGIKIDRISCDI